MQKTNKHSYDNMLLLDFMQSTEDVYLQRIGTLSRHAQVQTHPLSCCSAYRVIFQEIKMARNITKLLKKKRESTVNHIFGAQNRVSLHFSATSGAI